MRRAAIALFGGLAFLAACSYIVELPGVTLVPPLVEAGVLDGDVSDAPPYVPEASIPFCETRTSPFLFCEDFDNTPPPDLAAIGVVRSADGRVVVSNAVAFSPQRSLLTSASGADASAAITRTFVEATTNGATLSFQLLASTLSPSPARLAQLVFTDGAAVCKVQLIGGPTTFALAQVCTNAGAEVARTETDTTRPIPIGQWNRYAIGVVFTPAPVVRLEIDGVRVLELPAVAQLHAAPLSTDIGIDRLPTGSMVLFHDDVLVTTP